jgi:uncharacterized membrane protein YwaF
MTKLPIQLCEWGAYCAIFMITTLSDTLFGLNFYITLIGAGIAVLFPQTVISDCGPGYYRYYQFWGEHLLPIFAVFYVMIVHDKKPTYRFIWISYAAMLLLTIPATLLNMKYEEANYLYLRQKISFMPDSYGWRIVIYSAIMIILFHLLWGGWCLFERRKRKRPKETEAEDTQAV